MENYKLLREHEEMKEMICVLYEKLEQLHHRLEMLERKKEKEDG